MPVSHNKRQSGSLSRLLTILTCLIIFRMEPAALAETDGAAPSDPGDYTILFADSCNADQPIPDAIPDYVDFADSCLLNGDTEISSLEDDTRIMFQRMNDVRVRNGLTPLIWHDGAAEVSRIHGTDMLRRDYFAHRSPEGLSGTDRLRRFDRDEVFSVSAENLAYFGDGRPSSYNSLTLQNQLEQSPSHFKNMLSPEYTHFGAAIVKQGNVYIAVQMFLASEGQLDEDWPARLQVGYAYDLPELIGDKPVGGWQLQTDRGLVITKAYDRHIEIPPSEAGRVKLVILGEVSSSEYLLLNGPVSDLD